MTVNHYVLRFSFFVLRFTFFVLRFSFFLGIAVVSAGCVSLPDPEASQEYHADVIGMVGEGQSFGQSFVSRRPGLDSVYLWLSVDSGASPEGSLVAELFHEPGEDLPQVHIIKPLAEVARGNPLKLEFTQRPDPPEQGYYLSLKTRGGKVRVFGRNEDAYPKGQAFTNGRAVEADAAFRLAYAYGLPAIWSDLKVVLANLWLALPLGVILLLPGWLLLQLAKSGSRLDMGEKIGLAVGLSLAAIPLAMLWTTWLGLAWSRGAVLAAAGFLAVLGAWRVGAGLAAWSWRLGLPAKTSIPEGNEGAEASAGPSQGADLDPPAKASTPTNRGVEASAGPSQRIYRKSTGINLALLAIFLFSFAIRLVMVRDLAAPAWVDSVHHALIARLIVERGGFPAGYAPYLEIDTAGYHPGFHSLVAVFHWLSGMEIPEAMLLLGQVLNALSVFSVYLLAITLTRNRLAGLIAALIAGVFTPMPAYYTSWGRYTQLAGLLVLPAAASLVLQFLGFSPNPAKQEPGKGKTPWKAIILAAITCGGLFLIHYRVLAFLAALLVSHFASLVARQFAGPIYRHLGRMKIGKVWRPGRQEPEGVFGRALLIRAAWLCLAAGLAILLTVPWWPDTLRTLFLPKSSSWSGVAGGLFSDFTWSYLVSGLGKYTLALAGLGFLLAIFQRKGFVLTLLLWVVFLFLLANLGALGLPGGGFINSLSVEISLFLPVALLGGYLLAQSIQICSAWVPLQWQPSFTGLLAVAALALSLVGARHLIPILNPITLLFREADRPAIAWVHDHLNSNTRVLVNPFSWGYGLYAGNDGGFWITPLAGIKTVPPPVLYGFDNRFENIRGINQVIKQVMDKGNHPQELHALLTEAGIQVVYLGARGGSLSPRALVDSGFFEVLYAQDGVWVLGVKG